MYSEAAKNLKSQSPTSQRDNFLDIGEVLLAFMKEKKIASPNQLSQLSGVSVSEVHNVLKNRRAHAGLQTLQKIAAPLGKTLADIFAAIEQRKIGTIQKVDKETAYLVEFKKEGVSFRSEIPLRPDIFVGRMSLLGGSKGFGSEGLQADCTVILRTLKGTIEVEYAGSLHTVLTYEKIIFNARYPHTIKNQSKTNPADALLITTPSFWTVCPA